MASIIATHNSKTLSKSRDQQSNTNAKNCNCQAGIDSCPLLGKCLTKAVVYKATVTAGDDEVRTYIGSTDRTFKERYYGHTSDMRNSEARKSTKLSGYVWDKKDEGIEIKSIKWEIIKQCHTYKAGADKCDVCLSEKLAIMNNKERNSLNKRSELMSRCAHRWRYKLASFKNL